MYDVSLSELGRRVAGHRIARGFTQGDLAARAGVGRSTVQRIEGGESIQLSSLLKLREALGFGADPDAIVPQVPVSPLAQLHAQRRGVQLERKRVRHSSAETPPKEPWTWGDGAEGEDA